MNWCRSGSPGNARVQQLHGVESMKRSLRVVAIVFLIVSMVMPALPIEAEEGFTEDEVRTAVETWVRYVTADARPEAVVDHMDPYVVDGTLVGYIVHLQGGGFCLASANSLLVPVYFYSPAGTYDSKNPEYQHILWEMAERLHYLTEAQTQGEAGLEAYRSDLVKRASLWQDLIHGSIPPKVDRNEAAPLQMELGLTSRWGQGSPYNNQTPNLTPGQDEHAPTGCVATAIAQVMNYWQWPPQGTGSGSTIHNFRFRSYWDETPLANNPNIPANWPYNGRLRWTSAGGGRLQMNGYWDGNVYDAARGLNSSFGYQMALAILWDRLTEVSETINVNFGHQYQWELLQDVHTDPVDPGDVEIATLMLHVGVATGMGYGLFSSATWVGYGEPALEEHFGYDSDAEYHDGVDPATMVSELQWLRPIIFSALNENAGHAWVILGYNTGVYPWQFRMNMGWDGGADNWYSLDGVPLGLVNNRGYIVRIAPRNAVKFVGANSGGDGSPDDPYRNIQEAIVEAPSDSTLIFKAGSVNTFSSDSLTLHRPFILKGQDIVIRKQ